MNQTTGAASAAPTSAARRRLIKPYDRGHIIPKGVTILGSGYAALIAGVMLKGFCKSVKLIELTRRAESLSHGIQLTEHMLRFRTEDVSNATGIPFKPVRALRARRPDQSLSWENPVKTAMQYAYNATGCYTLDRSVTQPMGWVDRWIAPADFHQLLLELAPDLMVYDRAPVLEHWGDVIDLIRTDPIQDTDIIISTIPMNRLSRWLEKTEYEQHGDTPERDFYHEIDRACTSKMSRVFSISTTLTGEAHAINEYASVYLSDSGFFHRISLQGCQVIAEMHNGLSPDEIGFKTLCDGFYDCIERDLGIDRENVEIKEPRFMSNNKLLPIGNRERMEFIMRATRKYSIYSLGRLATWRPGLLLDDIPKDVKAIMRMVQGCITQAEYSWRLYS